MFKWARCFCFYKFLTAMPISPEQRKRLQVLVRKAMVLSDFPFGGRKMMEPIMHTLCRAALNRCTQAELAYIDMEVEPVFFTAEYVRAQLPIGAVAAPAAEPPPPPPIAVISNAKDTDKTWQVRNRARDIYLTTHRVELQDSVRQRDGLFKKTWRKLGCTQFASLSPLEQKPFLVAARTPRSKKRDATGAYLADGPTEELSETALLPVDLAPRKRISAAILLKKVAAVQFFDLQNGFSFKKVQRNI